MKLKLRFLLPFWAIVFFSFLPRASFAADGFRPPGARLNLLLVTIDTLRPDRLGCYDSPYLKTPQIDGLAQRGVLFTRAFAHNPETLPSHTNILLGTTPLYHGVHDNVNFIVRPEFLNLARWLKDRGYSTGAVVGAFPLDSRFGLTQGFDMYDDNYGWQNYDQLAFVERKAEVVVDRACRWLKDQAGPWFLWVHCFDPHHPYDPPEPYRTRYRSSLYTGEVAYTDDALGRLFSYLRDQKLEDKTLIIFTGDHGESLGEHGETTHGYFAYNSTIWIPLIIACPGLKAGRVNQNVSHIDIFPTVCDLLHIDKPPFLQGVSLVPAAEGKELAKRSIFFESLMSYYARGWAPLRGILEGNNKFIDSPIPELYDLEKDFNEANNLAAGSSLGAFQANLAELTKRQSSAQEPGARQAVDRETREKLKSLGYVSSHQAPPEKTYTAQDDLKTLLPYHSRVLEAAVLYQTGQAEVAIALLKQVVLERKDFDTAYTNLAYFLKEQRRMRESLDILRQGYENNPTSFRILVMYGIGLVEAGRFDEAIAILKQGLSVANIDAEAWNYLGVAYWNKGDFEEAQKAYEQALALDTNYPLAINNLGTLNLSIFLKSKDSQAYARAKENFKRAIDLDPKYASAYNGLGAVLKLGGDIDGAIDNWKKAVELKPDFAFALYNLGLAYLDKGKKPEALEYFTRYKDKVYSSLSLPERQKLDALIQKCSEKE